MIDVETLATRANEELARLVAFDTTSRDSNLNLISYVEKLLADLGIASKRVSNADGSKANLLATIGPMVAGGVVLSGHTDVVPVDGQAWSSDPWTLVQRGDKLYGRGSCDMKGFIALALAATPHFVAGGLKKPIHLAWSYDEEIGCVGVRGLLDRWTSLAAPPALCLVGEPTLMQVVPL